MSTAGPPTPSSVEEIHTLKLQVIKLQQRQAQMMCEIVQLQSTMRLLDKANNSQQKTGPVQRRTVKDRLGVKRVGTRMDDIQNGKAEVYEYDHHAKKV